MIDTTPPPPPPPPDEVSSEELAKLKLLNLQQDARAQTQTAAIDKITKIKHEQNIINQFRAIIALHALSSPDTLLWNQDEIQQFRGLVDLHDIVSPIVQPLATLNVSMMNDDNKTTLLNLIIKMDIPKIMFYLAMMWANRLYTTKLLIASEFNQRLETKGLKSDNKMTIMMDSQFEEYRNKKIKYAHYEHEPEVGTIFEVYKNLLDPDSKPIVFVSIRCISATADDFKAVQDVMDVLREKYFLPVEMMGISIDVADTCSPTSLEETTRLKSASLPDPPLPVPNNNTTHNPQTSWGEMYDKYYKSTTTHETSRGTTGVGRFGYTRYNFNSDADWNKYVDGEMIHDNSLLSRIGRFVKSEVRGGGPEEPSRMPQQQVKMPIMDLENIIKNSGAKDYITAKQKQGKYNLYFDVNFGLKVAFNLKSISNLIQQIPVFGIAIDKFVANIKRKMTASGIINHASSSVRTFFDIFGVLMSEEFKKALFFYSLFFNISVLRMVEYMRMLKCTTNWIYDYNGGSKTRKTSKTRKMKINSGRRIKSKSKSKSKRMGLMIGKSISRSRLNRYNRDHSHNRRKHYDN